MILRKRSLLAMGLLFGASLAQAEATSSASASAASTTPTIHKVSVGMDGYAYQPNTTYANVGDIIVFEFAPTNHSVIRAEYTDAPICGAGGCNPCIPYELIHPGAAGFFSGNFLTQNGDPNTEPTWNLTINDTQPIFFYCDAINSCHPNGMVGVINPNASTSLEKQFEAAVNAPYELAPGQAFPSEGGGSTTNSSTTSTGSSGGTHLSGGAIAGIVIAGVLVLLLALALFYFVGRNKTYSDILGGKGSSAVGGLGSQAGDLGPWNSPPPGSYVHDSRFSAVPGYGHVPSSSDGTFVGYNRHTGAPEFALEAPESPPPMSGGFSPRMTPGSFIQSKSSQRVELPGDVPSVAEKPPTER